ncbi:Ragulator complex protein LAMTOR5-like protein [Trichoplax sp. H2]|nr:Ragulator complex protein LAMTOR5-like protein [Trichoplax sp. H2]|eukprot:RDD47264.1 Ragulator complex protein LAMTOR5-like protein [Trichoplax sp. H2]
MEKDFEGKITEVANGKNVTGIVCSDTQGMCLKARGVCSKKQAGVVTAIIERAKELVSDTRTSRIDPIVIVEFQSRTIHFKYMKAITMAVHENIS